MALKTLSRQPFSGFTLRGARPVPEPTRPDSCPPSDPPSTPVEKALVGPDLLNLLAALRSRSDDEVGYLALADWCLEQPDDATQARGEHVRLSLALGKLPRTAPAAREMRMRLTAIEKRWRTAWLGPLREIAHRCDFLPGGLVKVEVTHGRALQARKTKALTEEQFAWVSSLQVRSALVDDLRWLARRLPAGHVHSFHVQVTAGDGLAEALSRCRWVRGLRDLSVSSHPQRLAEAEVVGVAGLRRLRNLGELTVANANFDVPAAAALAGSPCLRQLYKLTLHSCGLPPPALRALFSPAFNPPLTVLSLQASELSLAGVEVLASWPQLASVRKMTLDRNPLGDDGLVALARSPYLGEIRELSLQQCDLTTRGLKLLARAPFRKIESLDVSFNDGIGDAGLMAIYASRELSSLRRFVHSRYGVHGIRPRTVATLQARFGSGLNAAR